MLHVSGTFCLSFTQHQLIVPSVTFMSDFVNQCQFLTDAYLHKTIWFHSYFRCIMITFMYIMISFISYGLVPFSHWCILPYKIRFQSYLRYILVDLHSTVWFHLHLNSPAWFYLNPATLGTTTLALPLCHLHFAVKTFNSHIWYCDKVFKLWFHEEVPLAHKLTSSEFQVFNHTLADTKVLPYLLLNFILVNIHFTHTSMSIQFHSIYNQFHLHFY